MNHYINILLEELLISLQKEGLQLFENLNDDDFIKHSYNKQLLGVQGSYHKKLNIISLRKDCLFPNNESKQCTILHELIHAVRNKMGKYDKLSSIHSTAKSRYSAFSKSLQKDIIEILKIELTHWREETVAYILSEFILSDNGFSQKHIYGHNKSLSIWCFNNPSIFSEKERIVFCNNILKECIITFNYCKENYLTHSTTKHLEPFEKNLNQYINEEIIRNQSIFNKLSKTISKV